MKKEFKAVGGMTLVLAALLSAGKAGAEVSIGMEPVGYLSKPVAWGEISRNASAGKLSVAAEGLAEAMSSGDSARAEQALAGLFSGAAKKAAAAPVYASAVPAAAPVKKAAPAPVLPKLSLAKVAPAFEKVAEVTKAADSEDKPDREAIQAAAVAQAEAEMYADSLAAAAAEGGKEEEKPGQLWETALGYAIGIALVMLLCLL